MTAGPVRVGVGVEKESENREGREGEVVSVLRLVSVSSTERIGEEGSAKCGGA